MSLPPGFIDELRGRVSIAQVVGRKVTWDPRKSQPGRGDYWAPCPFHQEKTASFHVDEAKGYYHCFGCHAGGDAVTFLRETENLGFMEAVERLAAEAGMALPEADPAAAARAAVAKGLVEAMEAAVQFYRLQLGTARAAEARAYLDRRGLAAATRDRFEIGFAPDGRTALLDSLTDKGFARAQLVEAGLVGLREDGSAYDRFRGRIMFPIRDARGRAIAFGARALAQDQEPKYLNSPETPLFDKGRSLYNTGPARSAAARAGTVVVCEGYMDVIALAEAGIEHTVAPLGTAITETQLQLLWRLAPEPVVALDGDKAGQAAAQRLIDLALPLIEPGRALRFALMPAGQDPDDVVRAGGAKAMEALLAESLPMIELIWRRETDGAVLDSPERRAGLDARLKSHLARIGNEGLRAHYEAEIRARRAELFAPAPRAADAGRPRPAFGGKQGDWRGDGRGKGRGTPFGTALPAAATRASPLARPAPGLTAEARIHESAILAGCLSHPALAAEVEARLERMPFACNDLAAIRDALLSALPEHLDAGDLRGAVAARIGRDPMAELTAPGQVSANPHLQAGAEPAQARRAIEEELTRHAAASGWRAEVRDAERELTRATTGEGFGLADELLTWRLREAAEAVHQSASRPTSDSAAVDAEAEAALSGRLQQMIDGEIWKKPRKR